MQIDANGDEEDPARLEEQRAKLDRLFKASSSVDSTIQMPSQAASSSPFDVYSNSSISQVSPQDPLQPPGNAFVRGAAGREMASDRVFEAGVAADQVADTMDQAMSQSHTAIVSAVLSGSRRLTVSVNVPELDRTSRGYNETALYAWSSRVAASMATLATSDAAVKVVVQDIHAAAAAAAVFQKCDASSALLAEGRLVIRTLSEAQSGAEVVSESDSAVLLVAPRNTKENKVTKEVRGILLALGLTGKLIVVLNQALDAPGPDGAPSGSMPVEMRRFEEVFHIQVWALQGKVQSRYQAKDRPLPQAPPEVPRARRVALTRVFPGEWSLYVFQEEDQRYQLLKTMDKKPSERLVLQICARLLSPK